MNGKFPYQTILWYGIQKIWTKIYRAYRVISMADCLYWAVLEKIKIEKHFGNACAIVATQQCKTKVTCKESRKGARSCGCLRSDFISQKILERLW